MNIGGIYLAVAGTLVAVSLWRSHEKTFQALKISGKIALQMIPILFFIFVLMGGIQVFLPRETIAGLLGTGSGVTGVLLSEAVGSFALIMPAAVFPFSGYLLQSGSGYAAIAGFVLSAILIGVSTLPLEAKLFGVRFTIARNLLTFLAIFLVSLTIGGLL